MITHPSAAELLRAVAGWMESGGSSQGGYLALVARNALAIAQRELELAPQAEARAKVRLEALLGVQGDLPALESKLAAGLRQGSLTRETPGLFEHLRLQALDRLAIDQPRYRHELRTAA
jgi:hypothetical protein